MTGCSFPNPCNLSQRLGEQQAYQQCRGRDNGLSVDWYSIQHLLEYAASDVAIFLDCCYAASADKRSVDGTIEILAASGRETKTVGVCNWSFTSRLTEVLQDSREKPLTIAMLHAKLVNYRAAEGPKKLLRTPVHSIMSSKDKASIRLSSMALFGGLPGSPSPPALTVSDLSQQSSLSSSPGSLGSHPSLTRVLVAVSLKDRVQDVGEWLEWLTTHMPTDVTNLELIKPEGLWESHSTLGLISMPVAVWDLFPHTTAYHCLGFITTNNLLFKGLAPNSKDTLTSQTLEFKATTDDEDYYIPRRNYPYRFPIIRPDDIVLVVAGVQGAEKIRFMEKVIGDGLTIHNGSIQDVGCYSLLYKRRIIHLISTPADEATAKSEEEIFREITSNFKWQYGRTARTGRPTRFNGIICVHPISLEEYYLPDLYPWIRLRDVQSHQLKLILVTTESDNAKFALNEAKEQRLKKAISRHWYISGEEEVLSFRVEETRESALRAIKPFLQQTLHSEPPSSQLPLPDRARLSSKLKSTNIDDIGLLEKHAAEEEQAEEFPRKVAAAIEKLCTIM